jgi:hypothetical protein
MRNTIVSTLLALALAATGVSIASAGKDRDPRGTHQGFAEIEKNLP